MDTVNNKLMLLHIKILISFFFFFQAEDGIRDIGVTGVQTCALPISAVPLKTMFARSPIPTLSVSGVVSFETGRLSPVSEASAVCSATERINRPSVGKIGRASCRERV